MSELALELTTKTTGDAEFPSTLPPELAHIVVTMPDNSRKTKRQRLRAYCGGKIIPCTVELRYSEGKGEIILTISKPYFDLMTESEFEKIVEGEQI